MPSNSKRWRNPSAVVNTGAAAGGGGTNMFPVPSAQPSGDIKGTPSWMAPEIIREQGNNINWKKADVWSLACTTLEMTTGKPPWSQFNNSVTILYHIACQDTLPEYPTTASIELLTFLNMCLQRDPVSRPDITSLLLHPFVAYHSWNPNGPTGFMSVRPTTVSSAIVGEWDNPSYNSMNMYGSNVRQSTNQNHMNNTGGSNSASISGSVNFRRQAENVLNTSISNTSSGASGRYGINSGMNTPNLHGALNIDNVIPGSPTRESVASVLLSSRDNRDRDGARDPLLSSRDRRDGSQPNNAISDAPVIYGANVPYTIFDELNTARSSTTIRSAAPFIYAQIDENSDVDNAVITSESNLSVSIEPFNPQQQRMISEDVSSSNLLTGRSNDNLMRTSNDRQNTGRTATVSMPPIANNKLKLQLQHGRGGSNTAAAVNSISRKKRRERSHLQLSFDNEGATGTSDSELFDGDSNDLNSSFGTQSTEPHRHNSGKSSEAAYQHQPSTVTKHISPKNVSIPLLDIGLSHNGSDQPMNEKMAPKSGRKNSASTKKVAARNSAAHHGKQSEGSVGPYRYVNKVKESEDESATMAELRAIVDGISKSYDSDDNLSCGDNVSVESLTMQSQVTWGASNNDLDESNYQAKGITSSFSEEAISKGKAGGAGEGDTMAANNDEDSIPDDLSYNRFHNSDHENDNDEDDGNYIMHTSSDRRGGKYDDDDDKEADNIEEIYEEASIVGGSIHKTETQKPSEIPRVSPRILPKIVYPVDSKLGIATNIPSGGNAQAISSGGLTSPALHNNNSSSNNNNNTNATGSVLEASKSVSAASRGFTLNKHMTQINRSLDSGISSVGGFSPQKITRAKTTRMDRMRDKDSKDKSKDNTEEAQDALDISCDSLENLFVTGTAREFSAKPSNAASRMSSKRSNSSSLSSGTNTQSTSLIVYSGIDTPSNSNDKSSSNAEGMGVTGYARRQSDDVSNNTSNSNPIDMDPSQRRFNNNGTVRCYSTAPQMYSSNSLQSNSPCILHEHKAAVSRLRAPAKTNLLVSASVDGTIRIWASDSIQSRAVLDFNAFSPQAGSAVSSSSTSSTSNTIAATANSATGAANNKFPYSSPYSAAALQSSQSSKLNPVAAGQDVYDGDNGSANPAARSVRVLNAWVEDNCETIWGAYSDNTVRVWDGGEGRALRLLKGHEEAVTALEGMDSIGGNGSGTGQGAYCLVASGSSDRTVRVWDVRAKKPQVFLFRGLGDTVTVLRWGEGGRSLITGGKDKTIRIFDTRAGRLRVTLEKHFGAVNFIRVVSDSAVRGGIGSASSVAGGSLSGVGVGGTASKGEVLSFLSAGRDSMINSWSANGDCLASTTAHRGTVTFLSDIHYNFPYRNGSYTCNHPLMLSLGSDNAIKIWDLKRLKAVHEIQASNCNANANLGSNNAAINASSPAQPNSNVMSKAVWVGQAFVTASTSGAMKLYENISNTSSSSNFSSEGAISSGVITDWSCRDLVSHSQGCTDLISSEIFVASSSKSGKILRWSTSTNN
eukprot:gene21848-28279_t